MRKFNLKFILITFSTIVLLVFVTTLGLNFFGVIPSGGKQSADVGSPETSPPQAPSFDNIGKGEGTSGIKPNEEKIISNFYLTYETLTFENDMNSLKEMISTYNAYVESSDIYQQGSYDGKTYKYGTLTIKVPKDKANAFMEESKKRFHLVRENSTAQNVTLSYKDTELRLETLEKQKNRLNELYAQAERIEDIISIESKLSEVIIQIESLKNELSYLDRAVDYATVVVTLNEVATLTNSPDIRASFSERISVAFKDSLRFFKDAATEFAVFLVYAFPFIVILLVILIPSLLLIRKKHSKKM